MATTPEENTLNKKIPTSVGQETPQQTLDRALAMVSPTVSANDLANPPITTKVTEPKIGSVPAGVNQTIQNVKSETDNLIAAQTKEAERLNQLRDEQAAFGLNNDLASLQKDQLNQYGVPQSAKELKDINLQLNDIETQSGLSQVAIAGAAGQTLAQGQRELTQEDREFAVRSAGLAARAAILQGNIETGRALANDAVNLAFQERQLKAQNLRDQINDLSGVVDKQTQQLLDQKKRELDKEDERIKELKDAISAAIVSGATQQEMARLNDPNMSDEDKLALAQSIQARTALEDRSLDIQDKQSAIAARNAGVAQGWARIDLDERQFNYEQQQDAFARELEALQKAGSITEEQAQNQQKVENALRMKDLITQIRGHAGFNLSVGSVGSRFANPMELGLTGQLYNWLSGQGEGFDALYDQLTETLTLDNLDKMSGVLTDKDIEVLRSSATRLRKTTTEKEFLSVLTEMENTFDRAINENGITPQQARFYYSVDDETLNEAESIWNEEGTQTTTIGTSFDF